MIEQAANARGFCHDGSITERRISPRFISLIRAAKLVASDGEFLCVIRDVSAEGIGLRCFHSIPDGPLTLVLQNGESYPLKRAWSKDNTAASFVFPAPVNVERLIVETSIYPKRALRIKIDVPARISTLSQQCDARIRNLSQHGALLECAVHMALEQPLELDAGSLSQIPAKIRWRKRNIYGLAFDSTFTLREFAIQAAHIQSPDLLLRTGPGRQS